MNGEAREVQVAGDLAYGWEARAGGQRAATYSGFDLIDDLQIERPAAIAIEFQLHG